MELPLSDFENNKEEMIILIQDWTLEFKTY